MSKIWGIPPLKSGTQSTYFRRFSTTSHLNGYFNGLYLLRKQDIQNRASMLESTSSFLHRLKCHELWLINGLKLDRSFYTLLKFCTLLHCQASQTDIRKRNSTKLYKRDATIYVVPISCYISCPFDWFVYNQWSSYLRTVTKRETLLSKN